MLFNVATIASLLAVASARITSIAVPEVIAAGSPFTVEIIGTGYIQAVYDVAIAFGYAPGNGYPESLGLVLDSFYLGPSESNINGYIDRTLTIPAGTTGSGIITASLYSLEGAVAGPILVPFNVSITIGDKTSTTYKIGSLY